MCEMRECDVLVVGGGVAGIAAAVTSTRTGASTILVEKQSFIGGTIQSCFHNALCCFYSQDGEHIQGVVD